MLWSMDGNEPVNLRLRRIAGLEWDWKPEWRMGSGFEGFAIHPDSGRGHAFESEIRRFHIRVNDMAAVAIRDAQHAALRVDEIRREAREVAMRVSVDFHLQAFAIPKHVIRLADQQSLAD